MVKALGYEGQNKRPPYKEIRREIGDPARGISNRSAKAFENDRDRILSNGAGLEVDLHVTASNTVYFMLGTVHVHSQYQYRILTPFFAGVSLELG